MAKNDNFKNKKTAGSMIKTFRMQSDIPQDVMALTCGISQANFSAIENERREVGPKVALRLAAFMGVNPALLLYPGGYETQPEFKEVQRKAKITRNI